MLTKKTLFVVGAGASKEFDLPVGTELAAKIADYLDFRFDAGMLTHGDEVLYEAIHRKSAPNAGPFMSACDRIRTGIQHANSVDSFLNNHSHDEPMQFCGRVAIVRLVAMAERSSKLFASRDPSLIPVGGVRETWLARLFRVMQEGVSFSDMPLFFRNARFLIFNYDRCVERYFAAALQQAYGVNEATAQDVVRKADISHPYGTIGHLPWMAPPDAQAATLPFGTVEADWATLVPMIRTFADHHENQSELDRIKGWVEEAEVIVFLGFSYQQQNMKLVTPRQQVKAQVIGSALGLSDFNCDQIETDIDTRLQRGSGRIVLRNELRCADLISEYSRAFS